MTAEETIARMFVQGGAWKAERDGLAELLHLLVSEDECWFDHHGYCQAHMWLRDGECPHARAKRFLAALDEADQ